MGFLRYVDRQDFATAARYLQQPPGHDIDLVQLITETEALHPMFSGNIALLTDDPNGTVESGLSPNHVRAGVVSVGGKTADVILVRVDDPAVGKVWLISQETTASLAKLYAETKNTAPEGVDRIRIALLSGRKWLGMTSEQWFGWMLSIPISWLLSWLLALLLSAPRRIWRNFRKVSVRTVWETPLGMPLRCMIAILLHGIFVSLLEPPLLYRFYYFRLMTALLVGCCAWILSRLGDQGFDRAVSRIRAQHKGGESILVVMQRLNRVLLFILAFVIALSLLGLHVTTTLAGLGIGGIAIALAAQKSLENLIGGVSLLMDKAVQVGDLCKIGDHIGTVEDIGLRSLKLRTLDQTLLVVPNGSLAQMQFENLKSRPKLLIRQNFLLRIETRIEQLRFVLDSVERMLNENPAIESGTSRLRVIDFAGAAFELELFAYGKTGDWLTFTAIRQDIILKIAEIVESAGTRLAAPTRLNYQSADAGINVERVNDVVRHVTELRASDALRFPGEARTGTK